MPPVTVAAQALRATYATTGRPRTPPSSRRHHHQARPPDAAVKGIDQPFPTFGGRPVETQPWRSPPGSASGSATRTGRSLWDYEHLILEAFPGIYQARCLNHTQYEPSATGTGIYRELAPGHVTVVTIPDRSARRARSAAPVHRLRVLREIEQFAAGCRASPRCTSATPSSRRCASICGCGSATASTRPSTSTSSSGRSPSSFRRGRSAATLARLQRQGLQVGAGQLRRGAALRRLRE